jgi:hypothetical protein
MKLSRVVKSAILGVSLLLASGAFAAANKASFDLYDSATVAGKQLNAGNYTVQWDGGGPNVQVTIMKGKKVIATTPARVVQTETPSNHDAAVLKANGSGASSLAEIRFQGKRFVLDLDNTGAGGEGGSSGVR